uniref:Uncharacterized protein n=1 Tax=Fibrocapsa japonica TaxID=94617 RepID=A0A7S2UU66_9STRA|mmetsp:Transcript_13688/g.20140  ORF Transcript_13688/g.20140 Transcript_13688/m.20140 type:complete len:403 (+) Transcript_13688:39-1247(+)
MPPSSIVVKLKMVNSTLIFNRLVPNKLKQRRSKERTTENPTNTSNLESNAIANLRSWQEVESVGTCRPGFSGHGHIVIGSELYTFGGHGEDAGSEKNERLLGDLYCLNLKTFQWRLVRTHGCGPSPRASCTMCPGAHDGTFIVCGGYRTSSESDVFEFNTHDRHWRKLEVRSSGVDNGPIYGHTACLYKDSMILFGGTSGNLFWNGISTLNLLTMKQENVATTGDAPCPRYKHQSQIVGSKMYVIGGGTFTTCSKDIDVYCLDLIRYSWTKLCTSGDVPPARVAHSIAYDDSTRNILLWGGLDQNKNRQQDFFVLDVDTCIWRQIAQDTAKPPSRAFHAACFHEGSFFIFGGSSEHGRFSDTWRYPVRVTPPPLSSIIVKQCFHNHPEAMTSLQGMDMKILK